MDLVREKKARSLLEAEQMEGRARRNHMYFIGEKVLRSCKELQSTNKTLKYVLQLLYWKHYALFSISVHIIFFSDLITYDHSIGNEQQGHSIAIWVSAHVASHYHYGRSQ